MKKESTQLQGEGAVMFSKNFWILIVVLGLVVLFVWPTIYRNDHMNLGESRFPVRVNRITGSADRLTPVGWVKLEEQPMEEVELQSIPEPTRQMPMSSVMMPE